MIKPLFMASNSTTNQLKAALEECARLWEENRRLRTLLGIPEEKTVEKSAVSKSLSPEEKVAIFRGLFRGREDVYPVRWETISGKSGYSPACANEWVRPLCGKPRVKCSECENRKLLPVTDAVINSHLTGKHTIGVYPLLSDETCWFLAVDFDKATWIEDAGAFLRACDEMAVPAALERSRSGNGGHIWIFFESPIPASLARNLGSAILTHTMEGYPQLGLDSYDRFFPSQDTMPKGGFGNLIALPLQRRPRDKGNTLFLDKDFNPYPDQWAFLSCVRKMKQGEIESLISDAQGKGKIIGVRMSLTEQGSEDPWTLPPSGRKLEKDNRRAISQTLSLAMPISWRGTFQQYAGRLHRLHDNKRVVRIYDYVDINVPMLMRMYEKRLKGYRAIGYKVADSRT